MNVKDKIHNILRNYVIVSLIINMCILLILSLIAYPRYEQNIDIMMQGMLYNIVGYESSSYVLFMNIFLAKFLKTLISAFGSVAWYSVIQYVAVFISLSAISCLYLRREDGKLRRTILSIFLIFVGYECYIRPSYLKTSSILCVSGLFLLCAIIMSASSNIKKNVIAIIVSIGLVILSAMFSHTAFLYTLIITVVLIFFSMIIEKRNVLSFVYFGLTIVGIISFSVGLTTLDRHAYAQQDDKMYGYEFKDAVEKVTMFGYPSYTDDIGNEIEVSKRDYELASNGYYLCDDGQAILILDKIASLKSEVTPKNILKFFRTIPMNVLQNGIFYMVVMMAAFMWLSKGKNRKKFILAAIVAMGAYFFVYMNYAWNNSYAHFIIWVPIAALFMLCQSEIREIDYKNFLVWLAIFLAVLYNKFSGMIVTYIIDEDMTEKLYENIMEETTICCVDINTFLRNYSIFERYPEGLLEGYSIILLDGNYSIYTMFDDYIYSGDWTDETSITWLDWGRDYKAFLFESELVDE